MFQRSTPGLRSEVQNDCEWFALDACTLTNERWGAGNQGKTHASNLHIWCGQKCKLLECFPWTPASVDVACLNAARQSESHLKQVLT